MSKLIALAAGISAVSTGIAAITEASTNPFSPVAFGFMFAAFGVAMFAGYCLASGENSSGGKQEEEA